jgi:peptide/nickel transport system ATP-binding protein
MPPTDDVLLEVANLRTHFKLTEGTLKAVDDISFTIRRGRTLGLLGESGCGKSVTALSILRIVPASAKASGTVTYHGLGKPIDLIGLSPTGNIIRQIRGRDIAMIFQEPMTAFSPVHTIGDQLTEVILEHQQRPRAEVDARAVELLARVGIAMPERRVKEYPFQLSGGMRQRSMIAMALMMKPKLLIADEPTTALDVTIQAQILRLMKDLQAEMGMSILFITHNLGVITNMADDIAVMYLGKIVEQGNVRQVFHKPLHPYTQALLQSIPQVGKKAHQRLQAIGGSVPVPLDPPPVCGFFSRCTKAIAGRCDAAVPPLTETEPGHLVRCVLYQ